MKYFLISACVCLASVMVVMGNTAPTPVVVSASMRPSSTLMDVIFRVNDPDDATVKVRALAFINGERSFAKVIKPTSLVEGTASQLGDAITTNADHTLTWDVAADWNIDVGQLKFEILALDSRGLLRVDWITIPAAGGQPALTISKDTPASDNVLDALFWQYASGDPGLALANGYLTGTAASGNFSGLTLATNGSPNPNYGARYLFKKMNLDAASSAEINHANVTARAGLLNPGTWHLINRPYAGIDAVIAWGNNSYNQISVPTDLTEVAAIAAGYYHWLALKRDGTVAGWGNNGNGQISIPSGLSGVTAIAAGREHSLARKSDGSVVGWGNNSYGQITIPEGLSGVTAIAAGQYHSLARKSDGSVVGWGYNTYGQITIPEGLSGVTAIAAGRMHSLALKSDGSVVGWGYNNYGQVTIPEGLSGVTAIAANEYYSLALKNDGTVVGWGNNSSGQVTIPPGLSGVTAIAAGYTHCLALKSDGSVVGWGSNGSGEATIPPSLTGVSTIGAGNSFSVVVKGKAP